MTKRIYSLFLASLFSIAYLGAQDQGTISDEMTNNPEQNKQWRMGEYKYSAKPKNAWEKSPSIPSQVSLEPRSRKQMEFLPRPGISISRKKKRFLLPCFLSDPICKEVKCFPSFLPSFLAQFPPLSSSVG